MTYLHFPCDHVCNFHPFTHLPHPGIFVSGGVTNAPCSTVSAYRSTLMWYSPTSDAWTTLQSPEGGPSQVAAYINGSIYIQTRARLWKGRLDW